MGRETARGLYLESAEWQRATQRECAWRDRTSAGQADPPSNWWTPLISPGLIFDSGADSRIRNSDSLHRRKAGGDGSN